MKTTRNGKQYLLFCEDFEVGTLTDKGPWEGQRIGTVELNESVRKKVGWKAKIIRQALQAFSDYLDIADDQGSESQSKPMQTAIDRLEDGRIGHYLFVAKWHVVNESRVQRDITLTGFSHSPDRMSWKWRRTSKATEVPESTVPVFGQMKSASKYHLVVGSDGRHKVGGPPRHVGVYPKGEKVPLQHLLTIDLADLRSPFQYDPKGIRYLPLYYPLAYGSGGADIQYEVVSNESIRILDGADLVFDRETTYFGESCLPEAAADIVPLTYEEYRMTLMAADPNWELNPGDLRLWKKLGGNHVLRLGPAPHVNDGEQTCRNKECRLHRIPFHMESLISIPPFPINGSTQCWEEYDDVTLVFRFGLCPACRQVIAFNVCT